MSPLQLHHFYYHAVRRYVTFSSPPPKKTYVYTYICIYVRIIYVYNINVYNIKYVYSVLLHTYSLIDLKWLRTSSLFSASGAPFVQLLFYNPVTTRCPLLSVCSSLNLCLSAALLCYISMHSFIHALHFLSLLFCPCLSPFFSLSLIHFMFPSDIFITLHCFIRKSLKGFTFSLHLGNHCSCWIHVTWESMAE